MKQKHKWSGQLLNIFMENHIFEGFVVNPYDSYLGTGAKPIGDVSGTDIVSAFNPNQGDNNNEEDPKILAKLKHEKAILESETAILTAARNGIVEIVEKLIAKIPSSIYDLNLENKNVLLVAVENRRTNVVEALKKRFDKCNKMAIFNDLIQGVDERENTVLHLAATKSDRDWNISGAALQMMWHIKWFQYTKGLVPEHFTVRTNKDDKTAGELFKKSHEELVTKGSEWLKDTSESCSVVAALLAGVSFATSSTVPGGNRSETGEPALEGRPAFDAFALSSVIGLCFSVTALVMFLSILTSRKEAKDFRIDMPRKLLLGLSSLFLSIIAMFVAFCSGHFFLIDQKFKHIVFLIYSVTCFPVTLYAVAQLPLYIDLLRSIVTKVPKTSDKGEEI
ncbi:ankyrin repeat protein, putative [Medicago truncatula]|uniref:Ankyrin repeat protein, putative n=2 Tax=Medicago truncatula TaxID=3880 RepID=A0A072UW38_MEDTR|nr:ankyrin repeat protein, putative [Medicago truncatula]